MKVQAHQNLTLGIGVISNYVLHYLWEIGHSRFYLGYQAWPLSMHAPACLGCALGDLVISGIAYGITAKRFGSWRWVIGDKIARPALFWIGLGLGLTVVLEYIAQGVDMWQYAATMPTLLGVGLTPIGQWIVVPVLTLFVINTAQSISVRLSFPRKDRTAKANNNQRL